MKLVDLERHLRGHGCILHREGGAHRIWLNPANRKITSVPRHREIKEQGRHRARHLPAARNSQTLRTRA